MQPILWRIPFPKTISNQVVLEQNPHGTVTNSNLELAGITLHYLALETHANIKHKQIGILCDNRPSVAWVTKMASKADTPIAGRLLCGLSMRQRVTWLAPVMVSHIEGKENQMADFASRSFNKNSFSHTDDDSQFFIRFCTKYPLSQNLSWKFVRPMQKMTLLVLSTLYGQQLPLQCWMKK